MGKIYVQYGCGLSAPDLWMNFDSSPRLAVERLPIAGKLADMFGRRLFPANVRAGDIVKGLPLSSDSADGVYASHVLEHLPRNDVPIALQNTLRILKPGGLFRLIVPDLNWRVEEYRKLVSDGNCNAADFLFDACCIGRRARANGIMGRAREIFGNSDHKWMYDERQMMSLLAQAGFMNIRLCSFRDSGDPMFDLVEDEGRFFDQGRSELSIQAMKAV